MKTDLADRLFTVAGLLTPDECTALIERGEAVGFERAAVRTAAGPQRLPGIRDNDRAAFADAELAAELWRRLRPFVPDAADGAVPIGLDDEFRFYRYDVGQRFNRHKDGVVVKSPGVESRLTCLFYLNGDFEGGETAFYVDDAVAGVRAEVAAVVPRVEDALLFRHDWWHEGWALSEGRKYVLRSDVFYRTGA